MERIETSHIFYDNKELESSRKPLFDCIYSITADLNQTAKLSIYYRAALCAANRTKLSIIRASNCMKKQVLSFRLISRYYSRHNIGGHIQDPLREVYGSLSSLS